MQNRTKKSQKVESVTVEMSDEAVVLLQWRQDEFERMGFDVEEARILSETHIDLHQMSDLLDQGCSLILAKRILADTNFIGDDYDTTHQRGNQDPSRERAVAHRSPRGRKPPNSKGQSVPR